ncbi:MAG TPA: hypothetical protein VJ652_19130 [Noviherbaspirillum sp.]|nr:hypothetical protein [Noviherbaspirillum sp.]
MNMHHVPENEAGALGQVEKVSFLYKEYERLHGVIESYSQSAFDDVKLLAVLGLVFAWDPIVSLVKAPHASSEPEILLIGFVIILVASAIIAIRNLLKQSLMLYNLFQLDVYERQLRILLNQDDKKTFRWVEKWVQWFRMHHIHIASAFYGLYSFAVVIFSALVLYWRTTTLYVFIYVAIAMAVSAFPLWATYSLYRRLPAILENDPFQHFRVSIRVSRSR